MHFFPIAPDYVHLGLQCLELILYPSLDEVYLLVEVNSLVLNLLQHGPPSLVLKKHLQVIPLLLLHNGIRL